jgi:hypothetical protein
MVTVRAAAPADAETLGGLMKQQFEEHRQSAPWIRTEPDADWTAFALAKIQGGARQVFVSESNGLITGYIEVAIVDEAARRRGSWRVRIARRLLRRPKPVYVQPPRRYGMIHDLFVLNSARRSGDPIGFRLYCVAMDWFEGKSVSEIEGWTLSTNASIRDMGRRFGFEEAAVLYRKTI